MRILITGAAGAASRNLAYCLRQSPNDYTLIGVDTNPTMLHPYFGELYDRTSVCPPTSDVRNWGDHLAMQNADIIIPQPDGDVRAASQLATIGTLDASTLRLPNHQAICDAQDKLVAHLRYYKAGVQTPVFADLHRYTPAEAFDLVRYHAPHTDRFWVRCTHGAGSRGALPVSNPTDAHNWISYWERERNTPRTDWIISEYLPGNEYAVQQLWHDGTLLASATRRRETHLFANQMVSGQSSTPEIAVGEYREDVHTTATQAIQAIHKPTHTEPHGVYGVDLRCRADNTPCVTEINPGRFFTTSRMLYAAGANMPEWHVMLHHSPREASMLLPKNAWKQVIPNNFTWVRGVDTEPHQSIHPR